MPEKHVLHPENAMPGSRNAAPSVKNNHRLRIAAAAGALLLAAAAARADDFIVYAPTVIGGQTEAELRGHRIADGDPAVNGEYQYLYDVGHAFTDWWRVEFYPGEYLREPGGSRRLKGRELENFFQFGAPGEYWADTGLLVAYEDISASGSPNVLEVGPLFQKQMGRFTHRLNLIWEKEIGPHAARRYAFRTAYSLGYRLHRGFVPGIEAYALTADNAYYVGPVVSGELVSGRSEFAYSAGVVFGVNRNAADRSFVLRLEYEIF